MRAKARLTNQPRARRGVVGEEWMCGREGGRYRSRDRHLGFRLVMAVCLSRPPPRPQTPITNAPRAERGAKAAGGGLRTVAPAFRRGKAEPPRSEARFSGRQRLVRKPAFRPLKRAREMGWTGFPRLKTGATVLTPASPAKSRYPGVVTSNRQTPRRARGCIVRRTCARTNATLRGAWSDSLSRFLTAATAAQATLVSSLQPAPARYQPSTAARAS
jgi:hypothetical protein